MGGAMGDDSDDEEGEESQVEPHKPEANLDDLDGEQEDDLDNIRNEALAKVLMIYIRMHVLKKYFKRHDSLWKHFEIFVQLTLLDGFYFFLTHDFSFISSTTDFVHYRRFY